MPDLGLPPLDDEQLKSLLPQASCGCRSLADLRADWLAAIQAALPHRGSGRPWSARRPSESPFPAAAASRCATSRPAAGAGRADPGAVRSGGHAAHRRRPRAGAAAAAGPQLPAAAGDRRPGQLLGQHVSAGAQGAACPLSQARLARKSGRECDLDRRLRLSGLHQGSTNAHLRLLYLSLLLLLTPRLLPVPGTRAPHLPRDDLQHSSRRGDRRQAGSGADRGAHQAGAGRSRGLAGSRSRRSAQRPRRIWQSGWPS